ncbi:hypothetical protein V1477_001705 [Vespula maculifrons]|uniref:Uncharacterized protein n=1 Tax=Vespula maculifrons TaxID=7453 RepID=A0ABD2CZX6_VESMC
MIGTCYDQAFFLQDVDSVNLFVSVNNTVWPVFLERSKMDLARDVDGIGIAISSVIVNNTSWPVFLEISMEGYVVISFYCLDMDKRTIQRSSWKWSL